MRYYSTNNRTSFTSLKAAVLGGLAPDNGLYMPEHIDAFPPSFFESLHERDFREIAFEVAARLTGNEIPGSELKRIVGETLQFNAPLVSVEDDISALELFHGPTMAFKDFGARFMSRLLAHFSSGIDREIVILVATSGDTGSAVANGFLGVSGVRVVVLYPSGKVSDIQEKQFTTLSQNITAMEVDGTFDDCQRLVKQAFLDQTLKERFFLTSANSINVARLIPQAFYYFEAYARRKDRNLPVVFAVPSGNFGNLTGGLIAKRLGLPVRRFIAATNVNDVVPQYLASGLMEPRPSIPTISNAMDVGNPSNFARLMDLYGDNLQAVQKDIAGYSFTDAETEEAMRSVWRAAHYMLDPHGAVGYLGLKRYVAEHPGRVNGIFLETAHPAKFKEVVERALGVPVTVPETLRAFMRGDKQSIGIGPAYEGFKEALLALLGVD